MSIVGKFWLLCLAACAASGCTTMRAVESSELAATIAALEPGDRVSVRTPTDRYGNVNVVAITDTALELETLGDEHAVVNRADILELEVPEPARAKRAGLVAGIAVGAVVGLFLAAGYEFDF